MQASAPTASLELPRQPHASGRRRLTRGRLVRRGLVAADLFGLIAAFVVAQLLFGRGPGAALGAADEYAAFFASLPAWIVAAKLYQLYDRDEERTEHSTLDDVRGVFHLVTVGSWLFFVGAWLTGVADPQLSKIVCFWVLSVVVLPAARSAARAACRRDAAYVQRAVILGAGEVGQLAARKYAQHPEYGIAVAGFVDSRPLPLRPELSGMPVLGSEDELLGIVEEVGADRIVVAYSNEPPERTVATLRALRMRDVQVDIVPRLYELMGPNVDLHDVEGLPLVSLPAAKLFPFSRAIKRSIDVAGALLALIVTAPLFVYAAWRIRRDSPGPVFFRQERLGEGERPFVLLKFRTMRTGVDDDVHRSYIRETMKRHAAPNRNGLYKLDRDDAVTRVGRWLRRTSLDELPQLVNVLRGQMSLVGPRPCLEYETEFFEPHHFERFSVPAGITGLWQVTARAHTTFGEALELDVAYARNWSLSLDLKLLVRTPLQLVRQRRGTR